MSKSSHPHKKPVEKKINREIGKTNQFGLRDVGNHLRSLLINLFDCESTLNGFGNKIHQTHGDSIIMLDRDHNPKTRMVNIFSKVTTTQEDRQPSDTKQNKSLFQLSNVCEFLPDETLENNIFLREHLQKTPQLKSNQIKQARNQHQAAGLCRSAKPLASSALSTRASSDEFLSRKTFNYSREDELPQKNGTFSEKDHDMLFDNYRQKCDLHQICSFEHCNQTCSTDSNYSNDDSSLGKRNQVMSNHRMSSFLEKGLTSTRANYLAQFFPESDLTYQSLASNSSRDNGKSEPQFTCEDLLMEL